MLVGRFVSHFIFLTLFAFCAAAPTVLADSNYLNQFDNRKDLSDPFSLFRKSQPQKQKRVELKHNTPDPKAEADRVAKLLKKMNEGAKRDLKEAGVHNRGSARILPASSDLEVNVNQEWMNRSGSGNSLAGMVECLNANKGDSCAYPYAKQFVRYYVDLNMRVREITILIGKALIEEEVIEPRMWLHMQGILEHVQARIRHEEKYPYRLTHKNTLDRVVPDPKGEIELYYFFQLNEPNSEVMAPNVERLWRLVEDDESVKMAVLANSSVDGVNLESFRALTGLSMPIYDGSELIQELGIPAFPSLVIVTPNNDTYYVRNGRQGFGEVYEYVRKAQGLPATLTPEMKELLVTPIGMSEKNLKSQGQFPPKEIESFLSQPIEKKITYPVVPVKELETLSRF